MKINQQEKKKQFLLIGLVALGLFLVVLGLPYIFGKKGSKEEQPEIPKIEITKPEEQEAVAFKKTYGTELEKQKQETEELKRTITQLQEELKKERETKDQLRREPQRQQQQGFPAAPPPPPPAPAPAQQHAACQGQECTGVQPQTETVLRDLIVVEGKREELPQVKAEEPKKTTHKKGMTIPAGSFVPGVLLSGLDAPTGGNAKGNPHPVLIRLMDKAVLPNLWKSDVKHCFVIGSGYGDLSSERAYIRVETLSCVTRKGDIIETKADGYVAGEDGKVGLSGRVVTKQGQLLARALIAGFLDGVAQAYKSANTVVSVSPQGSVSTLSPDKALEVGLAGGGSAAASKLAEFYMKLVNEMYPVVEINAGRKVDVVFLKGVDLSAAGEKQQQQ